MTPRSIRRAAERKAMKAARKAERLTALHTPQPEFDDEQHKTHATANRKHSATTPSPARTHPPNRSCSRLLRCLRPNSRQIAPTPSYPPVPRLEKAAPNPL